MSKRKSKSALKFSGESKRAKFGLGLVAIVAASVASVMCFTGCSDNNTQQPELVPGPSAYELFIKNNPESTLTEKEWLESLKVNGESAYELFIKNNPGSTLTEKEWLESLKVDGESAYELFIKNNPGSTLTEEEWLESLKIKGESAYELYLKNNPDSTLTEEEWLESLKGKDGEDVKLDPQGLVFYLKSDDSYAVGGGTGKMLSEIIVPDTYNSKPVTEVVYDGFKDFRNLTTVNLPASVTKIDDGAFNGCNKLSSVSVGGEKIELVLVTTDRSYGVIKIDAKVEIGEDAFISTAYPEIVLSDSKDNDTKVEYTLKNSFADVPELKVKAKYNSVTDMFTETVIDTSKTTGSVDMGSYGLFKEVTVSALNADGSVIDSVNSQKIAVTADKYSIALLPGSYPVLIYSLYAVNNLSEGVPHFVAIERTNTYDWSQLPEGMYCYPFATKHDATDFSVHQGFSHLYPGLREFVAELYELNNDVVFTMYAGDFFPNLMLDFFVANRIPEEQWEVVLLSDGTGSAGVLVNTFSGLDEAKAQAKLADMIANWNQIKSFVYKSGYNYEQVKKLALYETDWDYVYMQQYAYAVAKSQPNVSWHVNRFRATENLARLDQNFAKIIQAESTDSSCSAFIKSVNSNTLLNNLSAEQAQLFKNVYNFNDDMFSVAQEQNKKVMILLGSSANSEGVSSSGNQKFYDYLKMTMDFYGDEYVYYYKGHPGHPTSLYPVRQNYIKQLVDEGYQFYEVDNAVAAEIILFYNPDVFMSGWASTTFQSVSSQEMACILFDQLEENANSNTNTGLYSDKVDKFISRVAAGATSINGYNGVALDSSHNYYLVQYNDGVYKENDDDTETKVYQNQADEYAKHEIAVYDATEATFAYYKQNDGGVYERVNADGTPFSEQ